MTAVTAFDQLAIARQVGELGAVVSPSTAEASNALYAPFHEQEPYKNVRVSRDIGYGSHERHRMDVFAPTGGTGRAVVVFVHGGGFVAGDKRRPGTPYFDNVALWAVRHGMVGVTMTYRLAPEYAWPAGAEDVASAVAWLRGNIAAHGGDPDRIHLMGTSAGAAHVASYLAHPEFHPPAGAGVASASLLSGAYDLPTFDPEILRPYYGDDQSRYAERSSLSGLVEADVRLLVVLAEHDPEISHRQAAALVNAYCDRHGHWPAFALLAGHNHFTVAGHLNTPDDSLGRHLLQLLE